MDLHFGERVGHEWVGLCGGHCWVEEMRTREMRTREVRTREVRKRQKSEKVAQQRTKHKGRRRVRVVTRLSIGGQKKLKEEWLVANDVTKDLFPAYGICPKSDRVAMNHTTKFLDI